MNPAHLEENLHELFVCKASNTGWAHFKYFTYNLQIGNADIEALIHVGMPHNPNIGNKKGSKITLKDANSKLKRGKELLLQTKQLIFKQLGIHPCLMSTIRFTGVVIKP